MRFVDFDWAGKAGEARYPVTRNSALSWAPGSEAGGCIETAHDRFALGIE